MSSNALEVFATLYRRKDMVPGFFLSQFGDNILVAAEESMPLLRIWSLNSQKELENARLLLTGPANAIAISHDDYYLAIGVDTKLLIWNRSTKKLITVQDKYLFKITCLKLSADSRFLITASENGHVMTYNFASLIMKNKTDQIEPLYSLTDHTKAVTDIHIGNFRRKLCFVTGSLDGTCQTYKLCNGRHVTRVVCEQPLTTVVLDQIGYNVFMGTDSGAIWRFGFQNTKIDHASFKWHTEKVNCLLVNRTNNILISGSDDSYVVTWNISNQQILHQLKYSGAVYDIQVVKDTHFFAHNLSPQLLKDLQTASGSKSKKIIASLTQYSSVLFNDDDENEGAANWERVCTLISTNISNAKCAS